MRRLLIAIFLTIFLVLAIYPIFYVTFPWTIPKLYLLAMLGSMVGFTLVITTNHSPKDHLHRSPVILDKDHCIRSL